MSASRWHQQTIVSEPLDCPADSLARRVVEGLQLCLAYPQASERRSIGKVEGRAERYRYPVDGASHMRPNWLEADLILGFSQRQCPLHARIYCWGLGRVPPRSSCIFTLRRIVSEHVAVNDALPRSRR